MSNNSCTSKVTLIDANNEIFNRNDNSMKLKQISKLLLDIVKEEEQKANNGANQSFKNNRFYSNSTPKISVLSFLGRIVKYTKAEESTLILALIYIDRICESSDVRLNLHLLHRLLLTSVLVALKYNEDDIFSNAYYAKVFGINSEELFRLELEFLFLIKYNLYVPAEEINLYSSYLDNYNI